MIDIPTPGDPANEKILPDERHLEGFLTKMY
jgi:hypothetical protein